MNLHFWFLLISVALFAGLAWGVTGRMVAAAASVLVLALAFFPGGALTGLVLVPALGAAWAYVRREEGVESAMNRTRYAVPVLAGILAVLWFVLVLPESGSSFPMLPSDTGRAAPALADFGLEMKEHPEAVIFLVAMAGALTAALWKNRKPGSAR